MIAAHTATAALAPAAVSNSDRPGAPVATSAAHAAAHTPTAAIATITPRRVPIDLASIRLTPCSSIEENSEFGDEQQAAAVERSQ